MFVGVEMGGTKVVMATGTCPENLSEPVRIPTTGPVETVEAIIEQIRVYTATYGAIEGIGIATFGPVGISPLQTNYGYILPTSKPNWSNFNLLEPIRKTFPDAMVVLETDVNGAALGEMRWGAGQGLTDFAYVTVGTGIGVGLVSGGKPVHGLLHPEAGHILVRRDRERDPYPGRCPFHGDCLEGVASGPTLFDRTGIAGEHLAPDDPSWHLVGEYLAQLYMNITLMTSPQRILVGGGVGLNTAVMAASRDHLHHLLGGYVGALENRSILDTYLEPAKLGDRAGVLGAIALVCQQGRRQAGGDGQRHDGQTAHITPQAASNVRV